MADISEININDIPYSIKDTIARNSIPTWNTLVNNPFISTSLDVYGFSTNENPIYSTLCLNDNITLKTNKWETLDSSPASFEPFIYYHDAKGEKVGEFSMYHKGDDTIGIQMQTSQFLNEQQKRNYFRIAITSTGEEIYQVSNPQNFRQAIGAVSLSGDTLTGSLTTSLQLTIKDDRIDANNPPESNVYPRHVVIKDKDNNERGYIEVYQRVKEGEQGVQLEAQRIVNDTTIYNAIKLGITQDGQRKVELTEVKPWQDALQVLPITEDGHTIRAIFQNNNLDNSATSLSSSYYSTFSFTDKNGNIVGFIEASQDATGETSLRFGARHNNNGINVDNAIRLKVNTSGKRSIVVTEQAPWRDALGASNGVWPISLGGTGATTAAAAWTALGGGAIGKKASLAASDIPSLDASKITTGTLAVARGGTGGSDSGWKTLTDGTSKYSGTIYYRKIGKICHVSTTNVKILAKLSNASLTLDTLPDGYRPAHIVSIGFGSNTTCGCATIQTDGDIVIRPQYMGSTTWTLAANSIVYLSATYLLA